MKLSCCVTPVLCTNVVVARLGYVYGWSITGEKNNKLLTKCVQSTILGPFYAWNFEDKKQYYMTCRYCTLLEWIYSRSYPYHKISRMRKLYLAQWRVDYERFNECACLKRLPRSDFFTDSSKHRLKSLLCVHTLIQAPFLATLSLFLQLISEEESLGDD